MGASCAESFGKCLENAVFELPEEKKKRTLIIIGTPGYDVSPAVKYVVDTFLFEELAVADAVNNAARNAVNGLLSDEIILKETNQITQYFKGQLILFKQKVVVNNFPKSNKQVENFKKDCGGQCKIIGMIYIKYGDEKIWKNRLVQVEKYSEEAADKIINQFKNETLKIIETYKSQGNFFEYAVQDQIDDKCKQAIDKVISDKKWGI